MIWQTPAALAALALIAGPVLVHLLIRRHAARVLFPAMRFVPAVRAAAVRLRAPSDPWLLWLRIAIVAAAATAAAQPVLVTAARERAWGARVAMAVVVDTSPSVDAGIAAGMADRAAIGAFVSHRFASADLRDALRRATEWLDTTTTARRAIVIVSDLQRGSLDAADVSGVPASTAIDILRAGAPKPPRSDAVVDGWRGGRWTGSVGLDPAATRVTWTRAGQSAPPGLTVRAAPDESGAADRAAAAARSFGVPAAQESRPVEIAFAGASLSADTAPATPWIATAAIALRASPLLEETGVTAQVGERAGVMTVRTSLSAASPLAPALIRAAIVAAGPRVIDPEAETAALDDHAIGRIVRQGEARPSSEWVPDQYDGRWLWALALVLLGVEARLRRHAATVQEAQPSSARATEGQHADAA